MERKWTDRQYHVQDNDDVAHQDGGIVLTQVNSQNYYFVVHIPKLIVQRD